MMAAKKWQLTYEVSFKLHSGQSHEEFILVADSLDDGLRKLCRAVILWAKKNDAIFVGAVLKNATNQWQALLPAVHVPN